MSGPVVVGVFFLGVLIGAAIWLPLGISEGRARAEAARPKHEHEWGQWSRIKVTKSYAFMGQKMGEPAITDGQQRLCKSCGWEELAEIGQR